MTVFEGTKVERFDVEVIDVLDNFRPDQDLILIRTKHPVLERAKTVAGMSGSPIYIDGRLAGAYAYGWPFGKEPVVGATPIREMLTEMRRPIRPDAFPGTEPLAASSARQEDIPRAGPTGTGEPGDGRRRWLAGLEPYRGEHARSPRQLLDAHAERVGATDAPSARQPDPVRTPVMLGGFTDRTASMLGDALKPFGLVTLQAGGGTSARPGTGKGEKLRYEPGSPLAVQLVRGDISATAVGTVTHTGGRRLVGFGHPMMNAGQIGLPTATARVLHVLSSQARSFKIAEATGPRGTLVHDRQSGIVVDPDRKPATVPVTIRLHGIEGAPRTEWNVEVASHRLLTPVLTFAAISNAIQATASDQAEVVYRARTRVKIEGHGTTEVEDRGFVPTGAASARAVASLRLFELMEAAFGNPFEQSRVTSVNVDLHLRYARDLFRIVEASIPGEEVDPGSDVNVRVTLRRLDEKDQTRVVPIHVPAHAAGEDIEIHVRPGDDVEIETAQPRNVDDLIEGIKKQYPATSLVVSLKMPSRGLRFRGHVVRSLPGSALDSLQLANRSGEIRPFVTEERRKVDLDDVLAGSASVQIKVRETPRP